ncbi:nischarin isoform 2-T2 [Polymixia lowei]
MDSVAFPEEVVEKKVWIIGSELVENYTVYIIEVTDGDHKWTVKHRYSDFHELHEKLTAESKVERHLLPPKKILGKNSRSLVEKRQKELEVYLQMLLVQFPTATPKALSCFLHFDVYEMNDITASLAEMLFHRGEQLLVAGEVFCLRPLQLHAVSQQLRQAKPTCCTDAKTHLGHILDFTCRLRYLKIQGTRGQVGTSNIQETSLPFDLSVFKSLLHIEITECRSQQIRGLPSLRSSLATLSIHHSTDSMMAVLVPEASEFSQWEAEGAESGSPLITLIPLWRNLTTLDMSHNTITTIDNSVKLVPKVEFLDLSHNRLVSVENLQYLYNLVHLDLSYNTLRVLEGAHTRLGNIKTLSLAGNQLDRLSGLSKLYSLVHLDLSSNQLAQLEEIRNIGSLPCLEKLILSNNPMCIIPDYRTKVLAQFWDRASEVCLDGCVTTEKELDTVEVLKAIQKAKEVKDRMSTNEKKISEETRLSAAVPPLLSSSCSSSAVAPPAVTSSCSSSSSPPCVAEQTSCPSQEVKNREEVVVSPSLLPPVDAAPSLACFNPNKHSLSYHQLQAQIPPTAACLSHHQHTHTSCICTSCRAGETEEHSLNTSCPVLSSHLLSLASSNKDFITQLSRRFSSALKEQQEREGRSPKPREVQPHMEGTEVGSPSPGSRDGYFEMSLDDSMEETLVSSCSSSTPLPAPVEEAIPQETQQQPQQQQQEEEVRVGRVLWCYCVRVEKVLEQKEVCLVLTDRLLGLFYISADLTWTNQDTEEQSPTLEEVLSGLRAELLLPYSHLLLSSQVELPDSCLALGVRSHQARWYLFSDPQKLKETRTELTALTQPKPLSEQQTTSEPTQNPQLFLHSLLNSWELEESQGTPGGYPAHLLLLPSSSSSPHPLLADLLSEKGSPERGGEQVSVPSFLFLTHRHLCVLKVDFTVLADLHPSSSSSSSSSWSKLIRVPLGSVAPHPRQRASSCSNRLFPQPAPPRRLHSVVLLLGQWRLLAVFPLAQDRLSFLGELGQRTASLEGLKTLALPWPPRPTLHEGHSSSRGHSCCCPSHSGPAHRDRKPQSCSCESSVLQKLSEENQLPSHLSLALSPGLRLLAGLPAQQLLACFQHYIAQCEGEELRQVLWLSVVLYKSPESELTSCLLLSTNAIYFLLEDSASLLSHHALWDLSEPRDVEACPCICLSIRLSELLSVNVGLFDQYFRLVGRSAEQIVCCLSRDSYGTASFLQEVMSALSLRQLPPPEPSEQDFYSQFTNTHTGKMQNYELVHSSRVKFVYPSEEEMGDLTFIVAERKTPASTTPSSSRSFNILLYLLVFQVQTPSSPTSPGPAPSGPSPSLPSSSPCPMLQPRTLILTSTDVFLLDEDYVSYPLPDFAKEPPSRERYQLQEARRIRDLDRVLLGYQTYPQALTLVFDDLPGPDLLCHLTMDHFTSAEAPPRGGGAGGGGAEAEVQWCIYVPGAESRERLICLLARQWEALCSRELPVELTG